MGGRDTLRSAPRRPAMTTVCYFEDADEERLHMRLPHKGARADGGTFTSLNRVGITGGQPMRSMKKATRHSPSALARKAYGLTVLVLISCLFSSGLARAQS